MEFHFEDFTEINYARLLRIASQHRHILPVRDIEHAPKPCCIWRHDVDVSVHRALRLAQIEADQGVVATYYLQLRSAFYSALEKPVVSAIRKIQSYGHEIGLHFDPAGYEHLSPSHDAWVDALIYERDILAHEIASQLQSFSFHNPTVAGWNELTEPRYGNLINAYGSLFQNLEYCSDSNGYWRHKRLGDVLTTDHSSSLYILTHPEWWVPEAMDPDQRIHRAVSGRADDSLIGWKALVQSAGRAVSFNKK